MSSRLRVWVEKMFKIKGITRPVVILGLVSLFTDLASEMLYPIIPLFITGTLGLSNSALGFIEGIAEGTKQGPRAQVTHA